MGVIGGKLGRGRIVEGGRVACSLTHDPAPKRAVTLVLALPRPPMLRRVLQHATAMGVGRIVLLHARRVEKSFWTAKAVDDAAIREQLVLGLEQAGTRCCLWWSARGSSGRSWRTRCRG